MILYVLADSYIPDISGLSMHPAYQTQNFLTSMLLFILRGTKIPSLLFINQKKQKDTRASEEFGL